MRKLKDLFLISVVLLLVSCSMSAKSDKNETGNVAAQGEVVVLNKADFLTKVYNYEKNQTEWVYEGTKPCIVDFYAGLVRTLQEDFSYIKGIGRRIQKTTSSFIRSMSITKRNWLPLSAYRASPYCLFLLKENRNWHRGALSKEQFVEQINGFLLGKK